MRKQRSYLPSNCLYLPQIRPGWDQDLYSLQRKRSSLSPLGVQCSIPSLHNFVLLKFESPSLCNITNSDSVFSSRIFTFEKQNFLLSKCCPHFHRRSQVGSQAIASNFRMYFMFQQLLLLSMNRPAESLHNITKQLHW